MSGRKTDFPPRRFVPARSRARPGRNLALSADEIYRFHAPSRDGIGKSYFGREISQIMGHQGAAWLERRTRVVEERPDRVVDGMELALDAQVADIGAGTGYFTFRIAEAVPKGRVYAVDVQPEMLEILRKRIERRAITNVTPVLGAEDDPKLPSGRLDAVLLVDAYHEFAHPLEMMQGIPPCAATGGRVVLIEYRGRGSAGSHQTAAQDDPSAGHHRVRSRRTALGRDPRHPAHTAFHGVRETRRGLIRFIKSAASSKPPPVSPGAS